MNSSLLFKASSLPMSIIIVGVGPAEFDGKMREVYAIRSKEIPVSLIFQRDQSDDAISGVFGVIT